MVIIERPFHTSQSETFPAGTEPPAEPGENQRERPPIGQLLKELRGPKTLRQVEADTGITNAYLSNIELGLKKPGMKTLAKLGFYYQVPLDHLLHIAGMAEEVPRPAQQESVINIHRAYDYVLADPSVIRFGKPAETPPIDTKRFVVQLYQHYTGRKLL